jgi:hypothetical protein
LACRFVIVVPVVWAGGSEEGAVCEGALTPPPQELKRRTPRITVQRSIRCTPFNDGVAERSASLALFRSTEREEGLIIK